RNVDAAQRTGEDGAAAVEGVAVDGLPVMHHLAWVFADQIWLDLLDGGGGGQRPAFGGGVRAGGKARGGVDLWEQPARLDEEGFELGDLERVLGRDGSVLAGLVLGCGAGLRKSGYAKGGDAGAGEDRTTADAVVGLVFLGHDAVPRKVI